MFNSLLTRYATIACASALLFGCSVSPRPYSDEELKQIAVADREMIFEAQEDFAETLTLGRAMSMALKYNLENRVRLLEEVVANQALDLAQLDLLPQLAASAGYLQRDNLNASKSVSIFTGNQSLEASTSQDKGRVNGDVRMTWNLLDFGVSYLQAKQDADRYLMAQRIREKVMINLLQEVRGTYWKAVAMERMRGELDEISGRVDDMLVNLQAVRDQQLRTPIAVLTDIRTLIETGQQLDEIRRSIDTAQAVLASLVNAPSFRALNIPYIEKLPDLVEVSDDIESMELLALANSTDYQNEIYKVRIEQLESRKAMLRLLPGLEFSYGDSYDDNSFLLNSTWGEFGANLTGDIGRLFFVGRIKKFRETNEQLVINRKLAINMAVIAGVNITWQDYNNAIKGLGRAQYLLEVDEEISQLTQNAQASKSGSGAASIQNELRAFRSKVSQLQTYADAQQAYGALLVSLGLNPIPEDYQQHTVDQLAEEVESGFERVVFPLSKKGEAFLAERTKLDEWVDQTEDSVRLNAPATASTTASTAPATTLTAPTSTESLSPEAQSLAGVEEAHAIQAESLSISEETQSDPWVTGKVLGEMPLEVAGVMEQVAKSLDSGDGSSSDFETSMASTAPPDLGSFVAPFWAKYYPGPDLNEYIGQFLARLPAGHDKESYLQNFLKALPDGPDRQEFINIFLEEIEDAPDLRQYLREFK